MVLPGQKVRLFNRNKNIAPKFGAQSLHHEILLTFEDHYGGRFTDYAKEGKAIKRMIQMSNIRAPDDPDNFLRTMVAKFWELKTTGSEFWQGQPFIPSTLSAVKIWDRVLENLRVPDSCEGLEDFIG